MGLKDIFLGSRPEYRLLPGMQDSINSLSGMKFGLGLAGKQAKRNLRLLDAGEDVSNIGSFSPIRQQEAADLSDIDMDFSTGANVLNASGSGDQASQLAALQQRFKERRREDTGRQMVGALADLRNSSTSTFMDAKRMRDANEQWRQQALMQARGNVYDARRQGGILPGLIQGAAGVGLGLLTGGASAALPVGQMTTKKAIGMLPSTTIPRSFY